MEPFFGTIVWHYCMVSGPTGYILAASPFGNKAPVHWHLEQWCLLPDQLFWSHAPFFGCCILRDLICILVQWTLLAAVFTEIYSVNCILLCASNILFCVVVVWCAWCLNVTYQQAKLDVLKIETWQTLIKMTLNHKFLWAFHFKTVVALHLNHIWSNLQPF